MENSIEIAQKTKNRTIILSCNATPGPISRENYKLKRYMHANVHCSTIYNSQDMEATYMSINNMCKEATYMSINKMCKEDYSAIKNELMLFAITWKGLEMIMLSKVSQRKINDIAYTWNLKGGE